MHKSRARTKKPPKRTLALPDLEHAQTSVLNSRDDAANDCCQQDDNANLMCSAMRYCHGILERLVAREDDRRAIISPR
jgi:hypothetical protein